MTRHQEPRQRQHDCPGNTVDTRPVGPHSARPGSRWLLVTALSGLVYGFALVMASTQARSAEAAASAAPSRPAASAAESGAGSAAESARTTVRGLLKAQAQSDLSVQIAAPVESIPKREGASFRRRDVLLKFDCKLLDAEWRAANAAWKARRLKARSKQRLLAYQAAGRLDAAIAAAEAEQAAAEARRARLKVQQCKVHAPYDGWVVERHVDIAETPQAGSKLLTIVKRGPLQAEMIVPAAWLKWLKPSQAFVFHVDGVGARLRGQVTRIGAVADEVSQTVRVYGVVETPPEQVKPGMAGQVEFLGARALSERARRKGKGGGA